MTHNEQRSSWIKEGLAALISGIIFGFSSAIIGHPFDTIKTKMQICNNYKGKNMLLSINLLQKSEGITGFFRGIVPPLLGSSIFRATQFSVFEAVYTFLDNKSSLLNCKIPYTFGLEPRLIIAGFLGGASRSVIECPFEYSKVNMQIGQKWEIRKIYQGFQAQFIRTTGLMTVFFILIDFFRRNTSAYNSNTGVFITNGFIGCTCFVLVWPLEVVKNQIQGLKDPKDNPGIINIIKERIKNSGVIGGLYRGILPGLVGVYLRNGFSMIAMIKVQHILTVNGFRK